MKNSNPILAALTLACLASMPCAANADERLKGLDGLDVTMEVLDNESEFDELTSRMRAPKVDGIDEADFEDNESGDRDGEGSTSLAGNEPDYDFESELAERDAFDDYESSFEVDLDDEDDFEQEDGEDVD